MFKITLLHLIKPNTDRPFFLDNKKQYMYITVHIFMAVPGPDWALLQNNMEVQPSQSCIPLLASNTLTQTDLLDEHCSTHLAL